MLRRLPLPVFHGFAFARLFPAGNHGPGVGLRRVAGGDHVEMDDDKGEQGERAQGVWICAVKYGLVREGGFGREGSGRISRKC